MAATKPQTGLTEFLQARYAAYTARGGSPETLARETGLHKETVRKYRTGEIPEPQYRGLVLLAMALGVSQNDLERGALSDSPLYHALLRRHHLRETGVLNQPVDAVFADSMRPSMEHTIRRLIAALGESIATYEIIASGGSDPSLERRDELVRSAMETMAVARAALSQFSPSDEQAVGGQARSRAEGVLSRASETAAQVRARREGREAPEEKHPPSE